MLYLVRLESKWTNEKKEEVVGYFTNDSIADATCSWAFHKHGVWTEEGIGLIKAGVIHLGGEGHGLWSMGTDSSDIKYVCYMGKDPVDVHGKLCNVGIKFTGQTKAGTDR